MGTERPGATPYSQARCQKPGVIENHLPAPLRRLVESLMLCWLHNATVDVVDRHGHGRCLGI